MDYKEAIEYLYRQLPMFSRVGAAAYKPGLDTSLALDAAFGHPHLRFRSIHVGGTNGKGSTSHMLAAILQAQGYKTALYTSPHLVDFRERMRINGEMIPRRRVAQFVEDFLASGYAGHPSFFELTMMMAFCWFAEEKVDYAIIEVGMGGRLDSTNIITPEACVITNISPDHMQFLGATLPAIAAEKAGIIKEGIPVVIGESEGEVRQVFARKSADVGAPITFADAESLLARCDASPNGGFDCLTTGGMKLHAELGGDYQKHNINTVLHAVEMLRGQGIEISDDAVRKGMAEVCSLTGLRGRWMKLSSAPLIIADTGHNEAGLRSNMAQLQSLLAERPEAQLRMVIGFVADKDIVHILKLLPADAVYYITNAQIPRALPAADLAERCAEAGLGSEGLHVFADVPSAYAAALRNAGPEDIIYVGGSTFVVADLLAALDGEAQ